MAAPAALDLLRKWLELTGETQRGLAARLNVGESTIWAWFSGRRRPSYEVAAVLQEVTGGVVPAVAWADPEDVAERLAHAREVAQNRAG